MAFPTKATIIGSVSTDMELLRPPDPMAGKVSVHYPVEPGSKTDEVSARIGSVVGAVMVPTAGIPPMGDSHLDQFPGASGWGYRRHRTPAGRAELKRELSHG